MELFVQFNQVGTTVLLSSHDEASLDKVRCRRLQLAAGSVVA
jgi:cell division transport system ATP-binding protein